MPKGAIDQLGHSPSWIIYAFASASDSEKGVHGKVGHKRWFLAFGCEEGEEWNFAYVLPATNGPSTKLVIQTPY